MQIDARINLLARVAHTGSPIAAKGAGDGSKSILSLAAASYGTRPSGDATVPTGFDPAAAALFEALVEGAYLVASADGVFDDKEQDVFERVVAAACGGAVTRDHVTALVSDLRDQVREDGVDQRVHAISSAVTKKEHAHEVLRIAALLAQASEDVSDVERTVLTKLAIGCGLSPSDVDSAVADVRAALKGG